MMSGVAGFAMSARWRAIAVAVTGAAAALLLPPLTSPLAYLSAATVALVTLRLGAREGFAVLAAAGLTLALLGLLAGDLAVPMSVGALVLWLPVWVLALILRGSRSLALTLQAAAGFGAIAVLAAHLLSGGDPVGWWAPRIGAILGPLLAEQGMDAGEYVPELARWMTALSAAALVLGVLLSLLLARAWQAGLYNPGGFGEEFRGLRLGWRFALAALAVIALTQLPVPGLAPLASDLVPALLVVYLLQGLALAHAIVRRRQAHRGWLIGLYLLLLFAAPQLVPLLALLGWLDAWIDVRARFGGGA